jgi:gamma-glutamyl phosphate reductase
LDFYFKDSISIRDNVLLASVSVSIGIISIIFLSAPNLELKIEAKEEDKLYQV